MNGLGLTPGVATLATALRQAGYSANYIGKWHSAQNPGHEHNWGPVAPQYRGGLLDFWEASNVLEMTSHPYEGDIFDSNGTPIHFSGTYRVDFITDRAVRFLQLVAQPFGLTISQMEPHFQNDVSRHVRCNRRGIVAPN